MWILWIIVGIGLLVVWLVWGSQLHCPRCGIELENAFGAPWSKVGRCRCGWRAGQRP